jgi:RNA polymerase sigma factor (TIGR02999 family)
MRKNAENGPQSRDWLPLVYRELRRKAQQYLKQERRDHTLTATALVHEAYLKLAGGNAGDFQHTAQFYAAAAQAMRRLLIDHARAHRAQKRGGVRNRLPGTVLDDVAQLSNSQPLEEILALDNALLRLQEQDDQAASVVRMRFYAGLSVEQTAAALGISPRTVKRDWQFARAWLYRELESTEQ